MNSIYLTRLSYGFNQLIHVNNLECYPEHWITVVAAVIINVCCTAFVHTDIVARIQTLA